MWIVQENVSKSRSQAVGAWYNNTCTYINTKSEFNIVKVIVNQY